MHIYGIITYVTLGGSRIVIEFHKVNYIYKELHLFDFMQKKILTNKEFKNILQNVHILRT